VKGLRLRSNALPRTSPRLQADVKKRKRTERGQPHDAQVRVQKEMSKVRNRNRERPTKHAPKLDGKRGAKRARKSHDLGKDSSWKRTTGKEEGIREKY